MNAMQIFSKNQNYQLEQCAQIMRASISDLGQTLGTDSGLWKDLNKYYRHNCFFCSPLREIVRWPLAIHIQQSRDWFVAMVWTDSESGRTIVGQKSPQSFFWNNKIKKIVRYTLTGKWLRRRNGFHLARHRMHHLQNRLRRCQSIGNCTHALASRHE